jgi:hypothetical protein
VRLEEKDIKKQYSLELMHFVPYKTGIERINYFNATKEELKLVNDFYSSTEEKQTNPKSRIDQYIDLAGLGVEATIFLNALKVIKIEDMDTIAKEDLVAKVLRFRCSYMNAISNKFFNDLLQQGIIPLDDFIDNIVVTALSCWMIISENKKLFDELCPQSYRSAYNRMMDYNFDKFTEEQKEQFSKFFDSKI